ncbi:sigma-70 family RNA polymerase sigma factor [Paenibacillus sp. M1]|uniref:Sigma-70 family RNA polymerase sigma factor n=1 Tax=Paenibacillus haidiansis TaxID=1574488 RepID=A0ABU7VNG2_9BACL
MEQLYQENKSVLTSLSYRLTGSWAEAEDIVQDTFAALFEHKDDLEHILSPVPYFRRAVVNRSLNVLKSSRISRESYKGVWLPEPQFDAAVQREEEPLIREEQVSYAFMVMLERLTPDERAVFVLRESFAVGYDEIAAILDKSEAACRKLLSRARQKLGPEIHDFRQSPEQSRLVSDWVGAFLKAARTGNFSPLLGMIREDAVMWSDGGGKVRSAIRPILSRSRIIAFWNGITRKGSLQGNLVPAMINGEPALLHYRDGTASKVILFEGDENGQIRNIYLITNPDKLIGAPSQNDLLTCL